MSSVQMYAPVFFAAYASAQNPEMGFLEAAVVIPALAAEGVSATAVAERSDSTVTQEIAALVNAGVIQVPDDLAKFTEILGWRLRSLTHTSDTTGFHPSTQELNQEFAEAGAAHLVINPDEYTLYAVSLVGWMTEGESNDPDHLLQVMASRAQSQNMLHGA